MQKYCPVTLKTEISNKYEIHNNFVYIEPRAILTNIISVFPSAKHVPHFATRKTANYISIELRRSCASQLRAHGRKFIGKRELHHPKIMEENTTAFHYLQFCKLRKALPQ